MYSARQLAGLTVPAAYVVGHTLAYRMVGVEASPLDVVHGHLGWLTAATAPLALLALTWVVVQGRRRHDWDLRWGQLCAQLVATYVVVESVEHLSLGMSVSEVLTAPTLVVGVLTQFGIGCCLFALLRAGHRFGEWLADAHAAYGHVSTPQRWQLRWSPVGNAPPAMTRPRSPPIFEAC